MRNIHVVSARRDARPWPEGTASVILQCLDLMAALALSTILVCLFVLFSLFPTLVTLELHDSRVEL